MTGGQWLTAAPLLVPLATALVTLALVRHPLAQRVAALVGLATLLLCSTTMLLAAMGGEVLRAQFGAWARPFAIEFRIDLMSALMLTVTASLALTTQVYESGSRRERRPLDQPLIQTLVAAAGGAYATAAVVNLYVWVEVMLMAVLGLLISQQRASHLAAAMKYFVLNVFGTALLLVAVAGLYGLTGQLNFAALGEALGSRADDALALTLLALLMTALLIKTGAVPFYAWLPASYPVLPPARLALFTALMTKAGAYSILRVSAELLPQGTPQFGALLGVLGVATMAVGVLGAVYHYDLRRILAFHSVSQIGYVLLAIALGGTAGAAAALFFIVHHIVVKANLYLIAGMIARASSFDVRRTTGLYRSNPRLALCFGLNAAALVGLPPLSGFWAKLLVVREGIAQEQYLWVAAALVTSALTLLSMSKIWLEAFWRPAEAAPSAATRQPSAYWWASGALTCAALAIGVVPRPLLELVTHAAAALTRSAPAVLP